MKDRVRGRARGRAPLAFAAWLSLAPALAGAQPATAPVVLPPRPLTSLDAGYPEGASGDAIVMLVIVVNADGSVRSAKHLCPRRLHRDRRPPPRRFPNHPLGNWDDAARDPLYLEVQNSMLAKETLQQQCGTSGCTPVAIGPVTIPSLGLEGGF